jgi:hypothetical protein
VAYSVSEWESAPRRVEIGGHVVRLDGLLDGDGHVLSVTGPEPHHITLSSRHKRRTPPDTAR